jgi:hypothetical protein
MFFIIFCFALYNLYTLYKFLGLGHISVGFFFVRICIVKVVIELMENIIWIFRVMPYDLVFKNLVHIY